jgi:hypothetical protein
MIKRFSSRSDRHKSLVDTGRLARTNLPRRYHHERGQQGDKKGKKRKQKSTVFYKVRLGWPQFGVAVALLSPFG